MSKMKESNEIENEKNGQDLENMQLNNDNDMDINDDNINIDLIDDTE